MNTHIVTRPFEGPGGRQFEAGEAVDASEWAHTAKLVDQRRLRPLGPNDSPETETKGKSKAARTAKEG